jgi:ATP-dependent RNA helicase RhlE
LLKVVQGKVRFSNGDACKDIQDECLCGRFRRPASCKRQTEETKKRKQNILNFDAFKFHPRISAAIEASGYSIPTPIQVQAIPEIMQGHDLVGLAQTGTGKTAAYALPLLNRLVKKTGRKTRALIIAPTRELAEQIHQEVKRLGGKTNVRSLTLYGGVGINPQIQELKRGAEIIVACPGRLIDHIQRGNVNFSCLEALILDEADQMLDMGFIPDIKRILKHIPRDRQTLMFSATMRPEIKKLANEVLRHPVTVQIGDPAPATTVSHTHFPVPPTLKTPLLLKILSDTQFASMLIFTRTKHRARRLSDILLKAGYASTSLQGNLSQGRRQAALSGFRTGKFQILVATDIAARGIDVSGVSHVLNYDIPATAEAYIHRIGRTGRAERKGMAFNLVTGEDQGIMRSIDRFLGSLVERRTYTDFDYGASSSSKPGKVRHQTRPVKSIRRAVR